MDINLLKTFVEVTKTRNFARAAENLYVTSAAVSARIKLLEGQLGVTLFLRNRGDMRLTNEAEKLLPLAETIIATWSRTLQEVSLQPTMETRMHIGAPPSLWLFVMEDKLLSIRSGLPELAIQAEAHSNETLVRMLEDQTLDLVLLPEPQTGEDIHSEKVGEILLVLCSTFGSSFETQLDKPYVFVDWGTAFAGFHARKLAERLIPTLHTNMARIAQTVIEAEGGSAYLPRSVGEQSEQLYEVSDAPQYRRAIYACYNESHVNKAIIRRVITMLKNISL